MIIIAPFSSPVLRAFKSDMPVMRKSLRVWALLAIPFSLYYLLMLLIAYLLVVGLMGVVSQLLIGLLSVFS